MDGCWQDASETSGRQHARAFLPKRPKTSSERFAIQREKEDETAASFEKKVF